MKNIDPRHLKEITWTGMAILLSILLSMPAGAEIASIQSTARPFGLDIAGPVMQSGSDARSTEFQANVLPSMNAWINTNLGESVSINDTTAISLDPSKLFLATASDARIYFVGEGAGYANTLGFNTTGTGILTGDPQLIFPNATSRTSYYNSDPDESVDRSLSYPVVPGDFVDIGSFEANTQLDFFLIANGARGGTNTYSTNTSINPDGINHVLAYAMPDSPYLLVGFEDLYGGGDQDYNDLLFAVDIGAVNVAVLTAVPEPTTLLTLASFLLIAVAVQRKKRTL